MEFPGSNMFNEMPNSMNQAQQPQLPDMSGTKATLFLFSPKEVIPQYRRSFNYTFGSKDINKIANYLEKCNTLGGITPKEAKLDGTCAECVLPSADATPINMSAFQGAWTFALILDINTPSSSIIGNDRIVYTGYIGGEPFSTDLIITDASPRHYNPHAMFVITHVTKLHEALSAIGDFMNSRPNYNLTIHDNDVIPGQLTQNLSPDGEHIFLNNPKDILTRCTAGSSDFNQFDSSGFSPEPVDKSAVPEPADASFNSPTEHLSRLMTGLSTYYRSDNGADIGKDNSLFSNENMLRGWGEKIADYSRSALNIRDNNKELSIDHQYTFEEFNKMWPNDLLRVHTIEAPEHYSFGQFEVRDTGGPSRQNIATAIITSAMPTTLTNRMVTDVAFSYCSYETGGDIHNYKGILQFNSMSTLIPMDPVSYTKTRDNLQRDIIDDVMMPIVANFGQLRVDVFCSVTGDTIVNLRLMDDYNDSGISVNNNSLGGINSSMLGNINQCVANASQLRVLGQTLSVNPQLG